MEGVTWTKAKTPWLPVEGGTTRLRGVHLLDRTLAADSTAREGPEGTVCQGHGHWARLQLC